MRRPGSHEKQKLPQSSQRNAGIGFTTEARRTQRSARKRGKTLRDVHEIITFSGKRPLPTFRPPDSIFESTSKRAETKEQLE